MPSEDSSAKEKDNSSIGELDLISRIKKVIGKTPQILADYDDAVAISIAGQNYGAIVINTDMLVGKTDIPPGMGYYNVGRKAAIMAISDVIVKGAEPRWAVVSLGIPPKVASSPDGNFTELVKGLKDGLDLYDTLYLGGDLNETEDLIVSVTVIGVSNLGRLLSRSGAREGDLIYITDTLGKTGCGFAVLLKNKKPADIDENILKSFIDAVYKPTVPPDIAPFLLQMMWADASADSSDGLLRTVAEICRASQKGAVIDFDSLPIAEGVKEFAEKTKIPLAELLLEAGEEFLQVFAVPPTAENALETYCNAKNIKLYKIGKITGKTGIIEIKGSYSTVIDVTKTDPGYVHFGGKSEVNKTELRDRQSDTSVNFITVGLPENLKLEPDIKEKIKGLRLRRPSPIDYMPKYYQYPGACGLTSLLMALRPEARGIEPILEHLWNKISIIFGDSPPRKEFRYQRVIEWLLFKILNEEALQSILKKGFGKRFDEDLFPALKHRIFIKHPDPKIRRKYVKEWIEPELPVYPNKKWIMGRIGVWKEDFELELIAYLFGTKFIPWKFSDDGTGAVYFGKEQQGSESFTEKLSFIRRYLSGGHPVLCCASVHWLAIKSIVPIKKDDSKYLVRFHDPANASEGYVLLSNLGMSDRFYVFEFSEKRLAENYPILLSLELDVPPEGEK